MLHKQIKVSEANWNKTTTDGGNSMGKDFYLLKTGIVTR